MKKLAAVLACLMILATGAALAQEPAARRSINVSGQGEVRVRPDRARLQLAVDALQADPKAAEAQVNAVVRAFVAEAKALGARDNEISTAAVSLTPEYVWDEKGRRNRLTGYRARRDISVTVTRLEQLGDYLLRATQVGVNTISPPLLEAAAARELSRQALVRATEDARDKAALLAGTLQMKLGPVRSLNATEGMTPPPMPKMMAMRAEAAFDSGNAQMGLEPGEITYSATVAADFDLLGP